MAYQAAKLALAIVGADFGDEYMRGYHDGVTWVLE